MTKMRIYYQQRHLLAHQQGIVDNDYVTRSGDATYEVGQRLLIKESAALKFADLVERLGTVLMVSVARPELSAAPPTPCQRS